MNTAKKADAKHIGLPLYDTVMERIGKPIVYNITMLGALLGITGIVRPESVLAILKERIPPDFLALNQRAFDLGLVLGAQYQYRL